MSHLAAPVHPGVLLAETLEERHMSQSYLAYVTGLSLKHVNTMIHGHCLYGVDTAIAIAAATGTSARFWLHLKADYQLAQRGALENAGRQDP